MWIQVSLSGGNQMAKKRTVKRVPWTKADDKELRTHSRSKTAVAKISKQMKRTVGALRQRALKLELPLGHRRYLVRLVRIHCRPAPLGPHSRNVGMGARSDRGYCGTASRHDRLS